MSATTTSPATRRRDEDLYAASVELLLDEQAPNGAWLACRDFPQYRYSWVRDGTFVARALDLVGHHDRAQAFHRWVADTVGRHAHKVESLSRSLHELEPGATPDDSLILHTRFTADGYEADGGWGNFQLDGYGFWLSGLSDHLRRTGGDVAPYREGVELVADYLAMLWDRPCYDCWEEYPAFRHPTTLAAVSAGLAAAASLLDDRELAAKSEATLRLATAGRYPHLVKMLADGVALSPPADPDDSPDELAAVAGHERRGRHLPPDTVDASALLVLGDLGPFPAGDPIVLRTLRQLQQGVVTPDGGVHRYLDDEYYGGGQWLLLAGAAAEASLRVGEQDAWRRSLAWIESHAGNGGHLPEQTPDRLRHPALYEPWVERWGAIATPLLWSHAMYITACGVVDS